jgi:hypothetical protein
VLAALLCRHRVQALHGYPATRFAQIPHQRLAEFEVAQNHDITGSSRIAFLFDGDLTEAAMREIADCLCYAPYPAGSGLEKSRSESASRDSKQQYGKQQ